MRSGCDSSRWTSHESPAPLTDSNAGRDSCSAAAAVNFLAGASSHSDPVAAVLQPDGMLQPGADGVALRSLQLVSNYRKRSAQAAEVGDSDVEKSPRNKRNGQGCLGAASETGADRVDEPTAADGQHLPGDAGDGSGGGPTSAPCASRRVVKLRRAYQ